MKIYNLFPLLAGPFDTWEPHLERAAAMGFDWVFVNPIQQPGRSGSLYSIADYFAINKNMLKPRARRTPEAQARAMTKQAQKLGLRLMIDLVINHCAVDSKLISAHPDWFVRDGGGVAHPFCVEEGGHKVVWQDLAQLDHRGPSRHALLDYCVKMVDWLVDLGFTGFRCDAAYQIPHDFWHQIIERCRANHSNLLFVAETLGCTPEETRETASAGFDAIFNSSKWWDFTSPWLMRQYELTRRIAPSISFPESHDTERLFNESGGNVDMQKQRYLFSALFSSGVMMPIGYEYGFRGKFDVVNTRPEHWESPNIDLTGFIADVNRIRDAHPVFAQEGPMQRLDHPNRSILFLWQGSENGGGEALLILNKDPHNRQHFYADDLYDCIQSPPPLRDLSPEWPLDYLPTPFEFDLSPGMGRVMVAG